MGDPKKISFSYDDGKGAPKEGVIKLEFESSEDGIILQGKPIYFDQVESIEAERTLLFVGLDDGRVLDFEFADEDEAEEMRRMLNELVGFFMEGTVKGK